MGTYVIGDIHGCFTQFNELRERIESKDTSATFILVGDIVGRGTEDEKMLDWAYNNITSDGKYQMVLGNHDDGFIEVFGNGEFETIYSIGKKANQNASVPYDEFKHLEKDKELMHKYAKFLSKQPLFKKMEINGQKYVIAHAWFSSQETEEKEIIDEEKKTERAFRQRYRLLWERDREDYDGKIILKYEPKNGEKLIHGHSPTLGSKNTIHRGYAPGKVWDMGTSVNVDCGLVFNVTKRKVFGFEYGNLAAYNLETGKSEYLLDIADGYAANDDEYYEDKKEREERERLEQERKRQEAKKKAEPYLLSFYKQVFNLAEIPTDKNKYRCEFNFLNDYMHNIDTGYESRKDYKFDFENNPVLAMATVEEKDKLYLYSKGYWLGADLNSNFRYKLFKHDKEYYLFGINGYNNEFAEVIVYVFRYSKGNQLLHYKVLTPYFYYDDAEKLLANDSKIAVRKDYWGNKSSGEEEPTGLMTCDFYDNKELFTVKILRNAGANFYARILDSKKNILSEFCHTY